MLCENCKKPIDTRTLRQNSSLHKFFKDLADELNASGADMRVVIRDEVPIMWDLDSVKKHLWKPLQKAIIGHDKTSKLKKKEIDKIYEPLMKVIGERTGLFVDFPSIEHLINEENK